MKRKFRWSYGLGKFRRLFERPERVISKDAQKGADVLGFDVQDIEEVVSGVLEREHFYKTMESEKFPGLWQDVYKLEFRGVPLYVKLQITDDDGGDDGEGTAVLIAFKHQ